MENLTLDRVPHKGVMGIETTFVTVTAEGIGAAWAVFMYLVIVEGEDGISFSSGKPG